MYTHTCEMCCQSTLYTEDGIVFRYDELYNYFNKKSKWWRIVHPVRFIEIKATLDTLAAIIDDMGK